MKLNGNKICCRGDQQVYSIDFFDSFDAYWGDNQLVLKHHIIKTMVQFK